MEGAFNNAWDETIELAERHKAAVWVSPMSGRNSFPEDHELFAGFLASDREKIVASLAGHDFILVLGAPAFTYHVEGFGPFVPEGATLVQLVDDPHIAAWTPVGMSIVTGIKLGISALLAAAAPPERPHPQLPPRAPRLSGESLTDKYLLQQIAALRPRASVIVEEAPSSRGPMHDYLPILDEHGFYTCASGGLGHGLPAAVGVALARRGEKVISVLGDGSAMYSIQGLWSAAQLKLPITFIIIKNGRYEALNDFAHHFGLQKPVGIDLPELDFCGYAKAQGLAAIRVDSSADLNEALAGAFASPIPILVEVVVES